MKSERYVRAIQISPPQAGTVKLQFSNNEDFREYAPRRKSFLKRNANNIFVVATVIAVIASFYIILPIAFEREERRIEIVRQTHCQQYGDAMNKWAQDKGLEQPCQ